MTVALPNDRGRPSSNGNLEIRGESEQLLLADIWTLRDPHHVTSGLIFSSYNLGEATPIELVPGHNITSHRLPILHDACNVHCLARAKYYAHGNFKFIFYKPFIRPNSFENVMLSGSGPSATYMAADHDTLQSID